MKDKIIFWLNADFTPFTIAKGITDAYDADLYAIIDITNKPKKFFQNQKLVNFKKVWYYHDHIDPSKKPNTEYLMSFEKKYNINLWTLAYNERLFYQFNDYYKFKSDEILSILEQECRLFESLIDEIKPDFLIMLDTSLHHDQLFYEICKKSGVKPLVLVGTRLGKRFAISSMTDNLDFLPSKFQGKTNSRSFKELREFKKNYDTFKFANEFENRFLSSKLDLIRAALHFLLFNDNSNIKTHYSYYGRTKLKVLIKSMINILKTNYRKSFVDKNFIQELNHEELFIYFPLHHEPERSLLLTAPFYTNQLDVITNIVKSLPIGYKLYVKEHPGMKSRDWRKISYYKYLMSLPNIRLIHPSVNLEELMDRCALVITISGTAGFESIFYQKPSIVMADTSFSMLSPIYRLKIIEDLSQAIHSSLDKEVNDPSELDQYIETLLENTFEFDLNKFGLDFGDKFYHGSFLVDVDISESEIKSFIDERKMVIQLLTSEYLKKIEQIKNSQKN